MRLNFLFIILFVFIRCGDKVAGDSEMYVGSYRISDQMVPYPYVFQQKEDSLFLFDNTGLLIDSAIRKHLDTTEFKFKDHHFTILHENSERIYAYDAMDSINFKLLDNGGISPKNAAKFTKISAAEKLNIDVLRKEIQEFVWKYDVIQDENSTPNEDLAIEKLYRFSKDSVEIITNYFYQEKSIISQHESKAYFIFQVDGNAFLSFQREIYNPQPIFQILNYNSDSIILRDFSSREVKDIIIYKDSTSLNDYSGLVKNAFQYSNCFDGYQGEYYFGDDVTFRKGNEYILEFVKADAPKEDKESGYIIIHFNINCKARLGNFGLIQMDKNFKKTAFSMEMVNHLISKVSDLDDFPSTYSTLDWLDFKDVHGFLMFKLDKGEIIDLSP